METVVNEVRTIAKRISYDELLTTTFGAQGSVTIHEILPEGWAIDDVRVETEVAFNGSGTRVLDLGVTGSAEAIFANLDVKAQGIKAPSVTKYRATAPVAVIATLTTATDNPTAGVVLITLKLVQVRRED
ncbi:MAG: hypothetical protein M0R75_06830 [Dehalococcoidia bacterium]|nr:hypothetical protein [Dehalococcoidia bacterium]